MKNSKFIFAAVSIVLIIASLSLVQVFCDKTIRKEVTTVYIGPKEYKPTFEQSVGSAKLFYDLHRGAIESIKVGDYDKAVKLLNDSLPHVGIGPEKAMVYGDLAEIYRDLGNLDKELEYIQLIPKYTMSDREKLKCKKRAEEIQSIMANPEGRNNLPERFPAPPIYGRPFETYREVAIAQANSKRYLDNASLLLRDRKYSEAIEEYKKAYYPESADNAFIESGLIQCYRGLNMRRETLTLIDYTLKNRNWAPENVKEFQNLREELIK